MSRAQLSAQDWTDAALRALADGGVAAVRVDVLARGLGVTRGSFYWHFADRDALLRVALEQWEQSVTAQVIERMADVADPVARFVQLVRAAFGPEPVPGLQPAIMAHASHPIVEPVLRRVTARRIDFIAEIFRDLGLAPAAARRRAIISYATYLGWLDLRRGPADIVPEAAQGPDSAATIDEVIGILLGSPNQCRLAKMIMMAETVSARNARDAGLPADRSYKPHSRCCASTSPAASYWALTHRPVPGSRSSTTTRPVPWWRTWIDSLPSSPETAAGMLTPGAPPRVRSYAIGPAMGEDRVALSPQEAKRLGLIRFMYLQGLEQAGRPHPLSSQALLSFHESVEMFLLLAAEHLNVSLPKSVNFEGYPRVFHAR